ncbi:hypothetical protein CYMTET_21844 [Cymbomonas tetramitiformis]|uniref:FACT complex subunit SSRP1 n=1 Tax=Cymbomonas tetramitiformis TaxID=36881 RepID=A0AAE0L2W6_9CHLO|nr:hypothetical protein CYMTET_21844 [Cymbomonas tetramitiformis]
MDKFISKFPHEKSISDLLCSLSSEAAATGLLQTLASANKDQPALVKDIANGLHAVLSAVKKGAAASSSEKPAATTLASTIDFSKCSCIIDDYSLISPRGKFKIGLFTDHLTLTNKNTELHVKYSSIANIAIIEKPKEGQACVIAKLCSGSHLQHGKQTFPTILFQAKLTATLDVAHPRPPPTDPNSRLQGPAAKVLSQALGLVTGKTVEAPDKQYFCAEGGAQSIGAHHKVNQGLLFPLRSGIIFLDRPALFLLATEVDYVDLGRANGASSTFDFRVVCKDGADYDFSMLARAAQGPLTEFLTRRKYRMGAEQAGQDQSGDEASESDDSDEDDEDFNPHADDRNEDAGDEGEEEEDDEDRGAGQPKGSENGDDSEGEEDEDEEDESSDDDDDESLVDSDAERDPDEKAAARCESHEAPPPPGKRRRLGNN